MKSLSLLLLVLVQQEIPFKPNEEFDVTLDYQFKPYRETERKTIDYSAHRKEGASLLYLVARVKIKNLAADEVRVNVTSDRENSIVNRKAAPDMVLTIEFGFIEDVKDQQTAHQFTVFLISPDKKKVSQIHLSIGKDGTFLVNDQKRGKF